MRELQIDDEDPATLFDNSSTFRDGAFTEEEKRSLSELERGTLELKAVMNAHEAFLNEVLVEVVVVVGGSSCGGDVGIVGSSDGGSGSGSRVRRRGV